MPGDGRRVTAARYELALEAGGAGTWHWDRRSGTVDWDAALEAIYGLEPGAFPGTFEAWLEHVHADDRAEVLRRLEAAVEGSDDYVVCYRSVRPDGQQRWIEARGRPLRDAGVVTGMIGVCHDVTEREEPRQRLELLAEAGRILGSSLDIEQTLGELAQIVVPRLADWCVVDLLVQGQLRPVAVVHRDPDKAAQVRALRERDGYARDFGAAEVMRTGELAFISEISDEMLQRAARGPEHLELLRELGLGSGIIAPLGAGHGTAGALTIVYAESGRRHSAEDVAVAEELARRASIVIENARLFDERSRVASLLQQALLPQELPEIPGVDLAARYETAAHTDIGGDFYDVTASGQGWMLVLGDVGGKGPAAATLTALARHSLRVAALRRPDPREAIEVLNAALLERSEEETFCTALCAHLTLRGDAAEALVAAGGHHPPLVLRADRTVEAPDCAGTLLGQFEELGLDQVKVILGRGDLLLLYTDGVEEARHGTELFGPERVRAALREAAGSDAAAVLAHLHAAVSSFQDRQADDVAMLAARIPP